MRITLGLMTILMNIQYKCYLFHFYSCKQVLIIANVLITVGNVFVGFLFEKIIFHKTKSTKINNLTSTEIKIYVQHEKKCTLENRALHNYQSTYV